MDLFTCVNLMILGELKKGVCEVLFNLVLTLWESIKLGHVGINL